MAVVNKLSMAKDKMRKASKSNNRICVLILSFEDEDFNYSWNIIIKATSSTTVLMYQSYISRVISYQCKIDVILTVMLPFKSSHVSRSSNSRGSSTSSLFNFTTPHDPTWILFLLLERIQTELGSPFDEDSRPFSQSWLSSSLHTATQDHNYEDSHIHIS